MLVGDRIRREHPSVAGIARQLGTTWNTVWAAVPAAVPGDGQRRVPLRWGWPGSMSTSTCGTKSANARTSRAGAGLILDRHGRPDPGCRRAATGDAAGPGRGPVREDRPRVARRPRTGLPPTV